MNSNDFCLCIKECCSNETDKTLQYIVQYEPLLKESYPLYALNEQVDYFNWASFAVRSAIRLLTFYNLPAEHFEEVLLLSLKSMDRSSLSMFSKTEMIV
ncbi:hypothetical protein H0A36_13420 [Endozoicomonas sp. SM1973]|uniref:Uncharacterized protein n=1 Tax=Spartinivicinus marinus TaxID=2994442 RepID=A0A853IAE1_9GAMM|nr:hypothetical protein [Spartinivicinus marinus]MCX4027018.1 hypothetical protein [Spartinivicinus marinus]NYZ67014.1 hypothetical protein [Spartinivicinus marinus]